MNFLSEFGVQPVLLVAQIVNFFILLFILQRFLYKPLLKVLEVRKQKIAESLKNAEEIEKKLDKVAKEREETLNKAAKEVRGLLDDANKMASKIIADAHLKAEENAQRISVKAEAAMKLEGDKLRQEIKNELAGLVISGLQKITGKVLTEKDQKALIEKSIKDLKD